jgi:hypothetical protein
VPPRGPSETASHIIPSTSWFCPAEYPQILLGLFSPSGSSFQSLLLLPTDPSAGEVEPRRFETAGGGRVSGRDRTRAAVDTPPCSGGTGRESQREPAHRFVRLCQKTRPARSDWLTLLSHWAVWEGMRYSGNLV